MTMPGREELVSDRAHIGTGLLQLPIWAHPWVPFWQERRVSQPSNRLQEGPDNSGQMPEINAGQIIGHSMVVGMQPIARDSMGHYAQTGEMYVVRAKKEILLRMWISTKRCAVFGELASKVRPLVTA